MTLETGNRIAASTWFSGPAAADGNDARIVSAQPTRLFARDQATR